MPFTPSEETPWEGRARMARARLAAGRSIQPAGTRLVRIGDNVFRFERTFVAIAEAELDDIDREALRRHP